MGEISLYFSHKSYEISMYEQFQEIVPGITSSRNNMKRALSHGLPDLYCPIVACRGNARAIGRPGYSVDPT